jgi:serine/threonine-protein kinase
MPDPISDDAFARFAVLNEFVTESRVDAARDFVAASASRGEAVSLPDALVRIGALVHNQRDIILERIRAQQERRARQLLHYRIVCRIGEGGMGAVYMAVDTQNHRPVALKILPRHLAADAEFMHRFDAESHAITQLQHENIVQGIATCKDRGRHFLVMEYCEGETLDRRMEREGALPGAEAIRITTQVARGLAYAHGEGFVHGDIKPANIMLLSSGAVKILDLGLSKRMGTPTLAQGDTAVGTPDYIAPEQALSEADIDGRADIYALGATLFHLVTGRTPFPGSTVLEVLTGHLQATLPDPRTIRMDVPGGIVFIIRRMMEKRREDRYPDCDALLVDLEWVTKK